MTQSERQRLVDDLRWLWHARRALRASPYYWLACVFDVAAEKRWKALRQGRKW